MASSLNTFRLQFLDSPDSRTTAGHSETKLIAPDIDAAIWEAARIPWPAGAGACRLSGLDGREVAYRFGASADGRPLMIVKFV